MNKRPIYRGCVLLMAAGLHWTAAGQDTPILVGDSSLIITPFDSDVWRFKRKAMVPVSAEVAVAKVQLKQSKTRDGEYSDVGSPACGPAFVKSECMSVELTYSYREHGALKNAVLSVKRKRAGVEFNWRHEGNSIPEDFQFVPPRRGDPDSSLLCTAATGCPEGKVRLIKVNGRSVELNPKLYHRLEITFRGLYPHGAKAAAK